MSGPTRKNLGIGLAVVLIAGLAAYKLYPQSLRIASVDSPAQAETAQVKDEALPAPSRPLFKKENPDNVTTVIAETPEANGRNGAPKILKTDLGLNVSPLCFEQLFGVDGPKGPIDVTTCERGSGYKNIQTGLDAGRYRSLYEFPLEPDMPAEKGFSSYELLGQVKAGTVVETYNETGGTGRFSNLVLVTLNGNTLTLVDQIAGGDRCNNGLVDARVENGRLIYTASITPGDFPVLAWGSDKGLKSYEDLEASAMSCFATATFDNGALAKISLNPEAGKQGADWTGQFSKQKCFNEKFRAEIAAGHKDLTAAEFKTFMDVFLKACAS